MALTDTEIKRAKSADEPYRMADSGNLFLWGKALAVGVSI